MIFSTKIKNLYPYINLMVLFIGLGWYMFAPAFSGPKIVILNSLLIYAVVAGILKLLYRKKIFNIDSFYFVGYFFDGAIIAIIIKLTGGINSEFYLVFFPVVILLSIFSENWKSILGAAWFGICYIAAVVPLNMEGHNLQSAAFRLGLIWLAGLISFAIAQYMRTSEKKLLQTLDTLNQRTWELESSQLQLSNIYETTRALSGILNLQQLLFAILRIAHHNFRYGSCDIFLSGPKEDKLLKYASLKNDNRHIFETPEPYNRDINELQKLVEDDSQVKIISAKFKDNDRIDIPLISRGKVIGLMQVITETGKNPSSRDKRLMIIFANAAAVAIDNSLLYGKTQELTITDELTDLYNYRHFLKTLAEELKRADRYRQKLSLLMLDIDHFKNVNDRYGHQTGNVVLREISNIIKQCVRDVDIVSRYGGEEFAVILPQTDQVEASSIAERIRETVELNNFPDSHNRRKIQVKVSIGACTYPGGIHSLKQLIDKVDGALYKAKALGRNQVYFLTQERRRTTEFIS